MKMKRRTKFNVRPVEERWLMRNGSVAHITHRGGGFAAGMIEGSMAVCCWHHGETEAGAGYDLLSQMQEPAAGAGGEICPA